LTDTSDGCDTHGRKCVMEGKRREFSREVKVEAVRLVTEGGMTIRQVASDLGIRPALLSRWKKKPRSSTTVRGCTQAWRT
jgi:transposase-like protein